MRTIANIATFAGREKFLERTLGSIVGQFDEINIWDNEVEAVNMTDRGKFAFLPKYQGEAVYYFTLDDDIIYPADYVARTIFHIEQTQAIITYHGRQLLGQGRNYYRGHKSYHCTAANEAYLKMDVPGTGVTAFRTDLFCPLAIIESKEERVSDLLFAIEAAKAGRPILLGIKPAGWVVIQPVPFTETIYGQEVMKCERQGRLADEVLLYLNNQQPPSTQPR
jgi:hypothetical protein